MKWSASLTIFHLSPSCLVCFLLSASFSLISHSAFSFVFTLSFSPSVISLSSPPAHLSSPSSPSLPLVPLCLCFTSYRVVPLLVSILFAVCESISRNKNFTNPINYAHFIFITRLHRPHRSDNSLMIQPPSWDVSLPLLSSPLHPHTPPPPFILLH